MLGQLAASVSEFQHALALFDHASALEAECERLTLPTFEPTDDMAEFMARTRERSRMRRAELGFVAWKRIAARDAAMTIYHVSVALDAINVRPDTALAGKVDQHLVKQSRKDFRAHFPDGIRMRDAISHSSDLVKSRAHVEHNAFRGPYVAGSLAMHGGGMLANVLDGRRLIFSIRPMHAPAARIVTFDVTAENLGKVAACVNLMFKAFHGADVQRRLDQPEGGGPPPSG